MDGPVRSKKFDDDDERRVCFLRYRVLEEWGRPAPVVHPVAVFGSHLCSYLEYIITYI